VYNNNFFGISLKNTGIYYVTTFHC